MPARSINPFSNNSSISTSLDEKGPRRSSFSKANNKLTSFFSTSPTKSNQPDAVAALRAAVVAQQQALLNNPSPHPGQQINSATLSLPKISLSTATGEKYTRMEQSTTTTTLFEPPSQEEQRRLVKQHAEFGPLGSKSHLYSSRFVDEQFPDPIEDEPPYYFLLTTYISYLVLIIFGHVRDFFGKRFKQNNYKHLRAQDGYAPLNSDFDNFYVRRLKMRINDCFARPITGVPGRYITLLDRKSDDYNLTFKMTGTTTETLNMSSYNYLGFAQSEGPCADATEEGIKKLGISTCSTRADVGTTSLHLEVEDLVAKFVGKPASMVFSMGFVTNATTFPALVGKGCLLISDELNHSSIRFGARLSGAMIEMFKHNDMRDLERVLREVIANGQPRTHRPWKKILIAVEGLYSMEGTICNLPALLALKRKYKFHLFIDEAHSVGALGPNGRGVCDYFGVDPAEVDILMGTLTKSFGANGGYVAADKAIIDKLRVTNACNIFGEAPAPPVLIQIQSALKLIIGDLMPGQGAERLQRLAFNSRYLRLGLKRLGFIVYGHDDSPIVPVLLYNPAKMPAFSHEMLKRKISVVVVGYPATPLVSSRARFCLSAAHTKDDLDRMLAACDEIGDILQLKFSSGIAGGAEPLPDGLTNEMEQEFNKQMEQTGKMPQVTPPRWKLEDVLKRGVQDVKAPLR
ncbi:serine palmitoyltransferase [Neofusicoccum parvum]|uniref:Serine palmitoyltransferase component n=2 Tax=Neofusicoccum TaxID=407951 RepID=A0ABR3SRX1_9PEZI|nr:serine palmitoyltransferase [Neofusicoccum parvum]GME44435.1 serine palmitoyltransferase [Neofusicoccum parvum]